MISKKSYRTIRAIKIHTSSYPSIQFATQITRDEREYIKFVENLDVYIFLRKSLDRIHVNKYFLNMVSEKQYKDFQNIIWDYYKSFGRDFSWRQTTDPYYILVSEVMLQQTQTHRVSGKFEHFISLFPDFQSLAQAQLRDVLFAWQGLGYNRRAMALQKIAQKVMDEYHGILSNVPEILITFPGIGKATAASICAFAFNKPTVFIETNIRAVYIHFFFQNYETIHDDDIFPLVEQTLDKKNPRLWYYALMDYGVMLKNKFPNPSRKSKHYTIQSKFEGSDRQIRGSILKILTRRSIATFDDLAILIDRDHNRIQKTLLDLQEEGFIKEKEGFFQII